jgi:hypothetical protein
MKMRHYLKFVPAILLPVVSMLCWVSSLPGTQVTQNTPTGSLMATSPVPNKSPAPQLPTDTSVPPTYTPEPTSLNFSGPYILFKGQSGIWITNPDGSFPTLVSEKVVQGDLRPSLSVANRQIAMVTQNDQGLDLMIVNIPGGEVETIAHLISITRDFEINYPFSEKAFATYAIRDYPDVAWQPGNGRLLAFTGAINGPTSDLYTYDTQTHEIKQLTSGLSQSISPIWSPDGAYILNFGVSWVPPFGGAIGSANRLDGVWAVRVSDGKLIALAKPKGNLPHFVGWLDAEHYITYDSDDKCDSTNLRSVNVVNGEEKSIMSYNFYNYIAQSPENGALLFSSAPGCSTSLGEGVFILLPGQTTPGKLLDKRAWGIEWLPEGKVFEAYPEALLSSDGITRYDPPVYDKSFEPAVSREGYQAWEVIENYQGRVVVRVPGGEWQTILDGLVDQLIWDPAEGKTLLIVLRDGSLYAASFPDFIPRLMANLGDNVNQAFWLP